MDWCEQLLTLCLPPKMCTVLSPICCLYACRLDPGRSYQERHCLHEFPAPCSRSFSQHNQWVLIIHINRVRCISLTDVLSWPFSDSCPHSAAFSTHIGFVSKQMHILLRAVLEHPSVPVYLDAQLLWQGQLLLSSKTQHALHFLFSTAWDKLTNQAPYILIIFPLFRHPLLSIFCERRSQFIVKRSHRSLFHIYPWGYNLVALKLILMMSGLS